MIRRFGLARARSAETRLGRDARPMIGQGSPAPPPHPPLYCSLGPDIVLSRAYPIEGLRETVTFLRTCSVGQSFLGLRVLSLTPTIAPTPRWPVPARGRTEFGTARRS